MRCDGPASPDQPDQPEDQFPAGGYYDYKRARFKTRLPVDRLYTASHFWIAPHEGKDKLWRVGMTRFATRMLGDLVEHDYEVKEGQAVKVGQIVGWVEGFKASTDLMAVMDGRFMGGNPLLQEDIDAIGVQPYGDGWLYLIEGDAEGHAMKIEEYMASLDRTIDMIQGKMG